MDENAEILIHNSLDAVEYHLKKQEEKSVSFALKMVHQVLSCEPNDSRAILLAGACNYWLGNTQESENYFKSVFDKDLWTSRPVEEIYADAFNGIAACAYSEGQIEKSRFYLKKAIGFCDKRHFLKNVNLLDGKNADSKSKVLVGSMFADDDEIQNRWLDIQLEFLKNTTENFDHVVCLDKESTGSFRNKTKVIEVRSDPHFYVHIWGLRKLMSYFLKVKNDYDFFLILDSDAFPTKPWLDNILKKMDPTDFFDSEGFCFFSCGINREIASLVRSENFEVRLHASVLFMKKESLENISFEHENAGVNLLGQPEKDIVVPKYEFENKTLSFPLIRTNQYNVHPLIAGIYFDSFYHHGAGSRSLRHTSDGYHDYQTTESAEHYRDLLFSDPQKFVSKLSGWSH